MSEMEKAESGYADFDIDGVHYRIKRNFLQEAMKATNIADMVKRCSDAGAECWWDNTKQQARIE